MQASRLVVMPTMGRGIANGTHSMENACPCYVAPPMGNCIANNIAREMFACYTVYRVNIEAVI